MKKSNRRVSILIISLLVLIPVCGGLAVVPIVLGAKQSRSSQKAVNRIATTKAKSKKSRARIRRKRAARLAATAQAGVDPVPQFDFHRLDRTGLSGLQQLMAQTHEGPALFGLREDDGDGFDEPQEAIKFYLKKRLPADERELPVDRYFEAQEQMRRMPQFSTALDRAWNSQAEMRVQMLAAPGQQKLGTWTSLGPGNIGGRTRSLLINPQDPAIMYAAGVAGGIWKSTNAGASWTPISDLIANIAIVSLAFDPKNSNTIYAGTGEGFQNSDGVRGAGIFKTTDAGQTWNRLNNTNNSNFYFVHDLVVSPNDSMRVYAGTANGVWRSTDGGETWTRVLSTMVSVGCTDLAIRTDKQTDYIFAACGSFVQATVFRNSDAGGTGSWDSVLTEVGMGRTVIGIAPSNQNVVYALSAEYRGASPYIHGLFAFFRSTSSGDSGSWGARIRNTDTGNKLGRSILSVPPSATATDCKYGTTDNFSGQSWYDLTIAVDPADENRVWVGSVDLYRTDDGGANWGLGGYSYLGSNFALGPIHPDQHTILFHPQYNGTTNQRMFVGNDGGIYRTDNARAAVGTGPAAHCNPQTSQVQWTALNNNYAVTQFYHGTVHPDGKSYFGGTQDNGTLRGTDSCDTRSRQLL